MAEESYNLSNELFEVGSLLLKHNQGELTKGEQTILNNWVNASAANKQLFAKLTNNDDLQAKLNQLHEIEGMKEAARKRVMESLFAGAIVAPIKRSTHPLWKTVAAAVAITAVVGTGAWFLLKKDKPQQVAVVTPTENKAADVTPGSYKAQLILDDGSAITLDSAGTGKLAQQGNMQVMNRGGQLLYQADATTEKKIIVQYIKKQPGDKCTR